ncbi:MAG: PHP domain-containing protein [Labedaea sp.]
MGHTGNGHTHDRWPDRGPVPSVVDTTVPDSELTPDQLSRRAMLRRSGLLGAGLAVGGALGSGGTAAAQDDLAQPGKLRWLAGDHHIHTQYSADGKYRVVDHVRHADGYGLDWMVITDHGGPQHVRVGVERVHPEIVAARREHQDVLVFQGLEWNVPAAEHGTVFVHPGPEEVAVLKEFESTFDGEVNGATASTPANEVLAITALDFLADALRRKRVDDALFVANHPARRGMDSPHEIRAWRDAQPHLAVGMEGAPGHQAASLPGPVGPGWWRGNYSSNAGPQSFPGYPPESYRTFGGFDWMTATVGGLWDSLLAEGKPWWITVNSDSHGVHLDTSRPGPGSDFEANGYLDDPVHGSTYNTLDGDYWPGQYSRTHVGAVRFSYRAVMDGIRAGRVWVDQGGLISGLDARLASAAGAVTLGGALSVRRGAEVRLVVDITLANGPNWAQFTPALSRVDVIVGDVLGAQADRDVFTTPNTRVVKSFEVNRSTGAVHLTYSLGRVDRPMYVRLRGTDGNRGAVGLLGADVDPNGPAMDPQGSVDPWMDLWFYSNPMWVLPA